MSLRGRTIRLAYVQPELREHLLPLLRTGMEHSSPEALKTYLKDHPGADKSNHSVKKDEKEKGKAKKDAPPKFGEKALDSIKKLFEKPPKEMKEAQEKLDKATQETFKDFDMSKAVDMSDPKNPKPTKKFVDKAIDGYFKHLPAITQYGAPLFFAAQMGANYWQNPAPGAFQVNATIAVTLGSMMYMMGAFITHYRDIDEKRDREEQRKVDEREERDRLRDESDRKYNEESDRKYEERKKNKKKAATTPGLNAKDLELAAKGAFKDPKKPTRAEFEALLTDVLKNHPELVEA